MIKHKILSPQGGSRKDDYQKRIWRVYFEDPDSEETNASAFISEQDLRYKKKIDSENKEAIQKYLGDWVENFKKDKNFQQLRGEYSIISDLESLESKKTF
ncbi:MAG: hypothetical protein Q7R98_00400 [Candidatus Jorgensenbacteria bacterium]|nr:hypothetical protein [Candidatus Jorgensenbacteria bacterium]